MRLDVKMDIYGVISTPELLNDIVNVAIDLTEGSEWRDFVRESDEDEAVAIVQYISTIGAEGYPFSMDIGDTRYEFEDLRSAVRDAGAGYRVLSSGEDSLGYNYAQSFRPGWDEERQAEIGGEDSPLVDYEKLRAAMALGMEAVEELVAEAEAVAMLPEARAVVVPNDVYLAWKASYDEENGTEPGMGV